MLPFDVQISPGTPIYEQLDKAIRRALAAGSLRPGDPFPSVRVISRELRINPNTTHKVVAALIDGGLLEVMPGRGTFVAQTLPPTAELREGLLRDDAKRLVAEAHRLKIPKKELEQLIDRLWNEE